MGSLGLNELILKTLGDNCIKNGQHVRIVDSVALENQFILSGQWNRLVWLSPPTCAIQMNIPFELPLIPYIWRIMHTGCVLSRFAVLWNWSTLGPFHGIVGHFLCLSNASVQHVCPNVKITISHFWYLIRRFAECEAYLYDRNPNGRQELAYLIQTIPWRGCWWPGDAWSQGINSYGVDIVYPEYPGHTTITVKDASVQFGMIAV